MKHKIRNHMVGIGGALALCGSPLYAATCSTVVTTTYMCFTSGANADNPQLSTMAVFELGGDKNSELTVTLSNISTADVLVPADVLTALFFSLTGASNLQEVSAKLSTASDPFKDSKVIYDPQGQPVADVVGGEWAFKTGLSGAPLGATAGISSSGFGLFGGATFPGNDLQKPKGVAGVQYGIVSAGDKEKTGNGGITGSGGLIKDTVIFKFKDVPAGTDFTKSGILGSVAFQYGTSLSEPCLSMNGRSCGVGPTQTPEPKTTFLLGLGFLALVAGRRFAYRR